jgi:hypothetical protein
MIKQKDFLRRFSASAMRPLKDHIEQSSMNATSLHITLEQGRNSLEFLKLFNEQFDFYFTHHKISKTDKGVMQRSCIFLGLRPGIVSRMADNYARSKATSYLVQS